MVIVYVGDCAQWQSSICCPAGRRRQLGVEPMASRFEILNGDHRTTCEIYYKDTEVLESIVLWRHCQSPCPRHCSSLPTVGSVAVTTQLTGSVARGAPPLPAAGGQQATAKIIAGEHDMICLLVLQTCGDHMIIISWYFNVYLHQC